MKLWTFFAIFLLGAICWEVGHRLLIYYEANGMKDTVEHRMAWILAFSGLVMGVVGLLEMVTRMEKAGYVKPALNNCDIYCARRKKEGGMKRMDTKGQINAATIVMLAIGFLLIAILTPIAMDQIVGANTTGWNAAVKTIFTVLLPILFVIGVAIRYVPRG